MSVSVVAGFIGSRLVDRLLKDENSVVTQSKKNADVIIYNEMKNHDCK